MKSKKAREKQKWWGKGKEVVIRPTPIPGTRVLRSIRLDWSLSFWLKENRTWEGETINTVKCETEPGNKDTINVQETESKWRRRRRSKEKTRENLNTGSSAIISRLDVYLNVCVCFFLLSSCLPFLSLFYFFFPRAHTSSLLLAYPKWTWKHNSQEKWINLVQLKKVYSKMLTFFLSLSLFNSFTFLFVLF